MTNKLDILADYYPIDQILQDNDINPLVVIKYLEREGLIDLSDYFPDEEGEEE